MADSSTEVGQPARRQPKRKLPQLAAEDSPTLVQRSRALPPGPEPLARRAVARSVSSHGHDSQAVPGEFQAIDRQQLRTPILHHDDAADVFPPALVLSTQPGRPAPLDDNAHAMQNEAFDTFTPAAI